MHMPTATPTVDLTDRRISRHIRTLLDAAGEEQKHLARGAENSAQKHEKTLASLSQRGSFVAWGEQSLHS